MPYADAEKARANRVAYRSKQRNAERVYRASAKGKVAKRRDDKKRQSALQDVRMLDHTFVGVDGEGWTDSFQDHHYMMLLAGTDYLYTGEPLRSEECLLFLSQLWQIPNQYYVSFFFDYDVTMILRDMVKEEPTLAKQLFEPRPAGRLVWWRGFGIDYRPHKHLTVKKWTDDNTSKAVTIHDVQGFFQSSFAVALDKFDIGTTKERERIDNMKAQRADFTGEQAVDILHYSQLECRLLAKMVAKLRDMTHLARINASPYEGPGDMARRALTRYYGRESHQESMQHIPERVDSWSYKAYYGGRFEIMAHGPIPQRIYEYDLHSAYPYAMTQLPCLRHGKWHVGQPPDGQLYIAEASFDMGGWNYDQLGERVAPEWGQANPLPQRGKAGYIYYPNTGHGWYWSHELDLVPEEHLQVKSAMWLEPTCECRPFGWVEDLYYERAALEKDRPGSGIALKLMLNTLYGKMAQQKPVPGSFLNFTYASLITSMTRARLYAAYQSLPERSVVMFATDAIFTTQQLAEDDKLGGWELAKTYDDLTIFQPGVYFDGDQAAFKTRGIPKKIFRDHAIWLKAIALDFEARHPVTLESHMGIRLALARNNLTQLGNWVVNEKRMSANPIMKRHPKLRNEWDGIWWSRPQPHRRELMHNGMPSTYIPKRGEITDIAEGRIVDDIISDGFYEGDF